MWIVNGESVSMEEVKQNIFKRKEGNESITGFSGHFQALSELTLLWCSSALPLKMRFSADLSTRPSTMNQDRRLLDGCGDPDGL